MAAQAGLSADGLSPKDIEWSLGGRRTERQNLKFKTPSTGAVENSGRKILFLPELGSKSTCILDDSGG